MDEIDNSIRMNNELALKFDIEKNIFYSSISAKEKQISEMEYLVLQKLPTEFSSFEFLFNKELEIHNKMKMENNNLYNANEALSNELQEMIKVYKSVAHIDLEKTKEGYLKITYFKDLKNTKFPDGAHLVVEIKEGGFKIISVFPQIKITHFEEELQNSHNFTLFLTKLANEFLKYINN